MLGVIRIGHHACVYGRRRFVQSWCRAPHGKHRLRTRQSLRRTYGVDTET